MVVCRGNFHDVAADQVDPAEPTQDHHQFATSHPGNFGSSGTGRVRGIEDVDVDRQIDRPISDAVSDPLGDDIDPQGLYVVAGNSPEAERSVALHIRRPVYRTPDAHVHRCVSIEQSFLRCSSKRGAVGEALTEVGVPGVEMCVEMDESDRSEPPGNGFEERV